jgi:hypothetical protein
VDEIVDEVEQVPLFAAEVAGGALLVGLVLGAALLGYFFLRRLRIAASAPSLSCGLRENHGRARWRSAFVRLGHEELDCFAVFGIGLRPIRSWPRATVDVGSPRDAGGGVPGLREPVIVSVAAADGAQGVELAIERSAYPALRSWAESGPPRPNSVV